MISMYGNSEFSRLDLSANVAGRGSLDGAAHGGAGTEDLAHSPSQILGKRAVTNLTGNLNNLIESQVAVMLDVLLLLAITGGLLEGLDDVAGRAGLDLEGGHTVSDGQLDTDTEAFVVLGLLGNVFLDLLGGLHNKTERGD